MTGGDNTRQVNQTLEGISGEILQENVQSELTNSANQEVSLRSYERSPPPTGQPLGKKLPAELVGDLLEVSTFALYAFSHCSYLSPFQCQISSKLIST